MELLILGGIILSLCSYFAGIYTEQKRVESKIPRIYMNGMDGLNKPITHKKKTVYMVGLDGTKRIETLTWN